MLRGMGKSFSRGQNMCGIFLRIWDKAKEMFNEKCHEFGMHQSRDFWILFTKIPHNSALSTEIPHIRSCLRECQRHFAGNCERSQTENSDSGKKIDWTLSIQFLFLFNKIPI